MWGTNSHEV